MEKVLFCVVLLIYWCEALKLVKPVNDTVELPPKKFSCDGDSCLVTSENFFHLQDMIDSDRVIVFNMEALTVDMPRGFIHIKSVSNLTIMGLSGEGTVISCSQKSSFGFHISSNAVDITLINLTIQNCGDTALYPIPDVQCQLCSSSNFGHIETTFYIEGSSNVTLSNVNIQNSPGYAVTDIVDFSTNFFGDTFGEEPVYNVIIRNCSISGSQQGALVLNGTRNFLVDTFITNSSTGIVSGNADIEMINVVVTGCPASTLQNGILVVKERFDMNHSSLNVRNQWISFKSSQVSFLGGSHNSAFFPGFFGTDSFLVIEGNSWVLFKDFNLTTPYSALFLLASNLVMRDNSRLILSSNTARNGASIFALISSRVSMTDEALLQVNQNSVEEGWVVLSAFDSHWETQSNTGINVSDNKASNGGIILELDKTQVDMIGNVSLLLQSNVAFNQSTVTYVDREIALFDSSNFKIVENSAFEKSEILRINGSIISNDVTVTISVVNNSAAVESSIISFQQPLQDRGPKMSHYFKLLREYEKERYMDVVPSAKPVSTIVKNISDVFDLSNSIDSLELPEEDDDLSLSDLDDDFDDKISTTDNSGRIIDLTTGRIVGIAAPKNQPNKHTTFELQGSLSFTGNVLRQQSVGLACIGCTIIANSGKIVFSKNRCHKSSNIIFLKDATTIAKKESYLDFTGNNMYRDSSILLSLHGKWQIELNSKVSVTDNTGKNGFLILFFSTAIVVDGSLTVANNNFSDFGALNIFNTKAKFHGHLKVSGNRAESGGITADNSNVVITGTAIFSDNHAANGGGLSLITSLLRVSPKATVEFSRNHAEGLGGAIYISKPRTRYTCDSLKSTASICSIQVLHDEYPITCKLFSLSFSQNKADIAGNAIYGGQTAACVPSDTCFNCPVPDVSEIFQYHGVNDSSDLSNFTSDPTRVCFCENGRPDCYKTLTNITVYPGEHFNLSLAIVGYGLGTVPGSVISRTKRTEARESLFGSSLQISQEIQGTECQEIEYSIVSEADQEMMALAAESQSFGRSLEEVEAVVDFQRTRNIDNISPILRSPYDSIFESFFHIPVFVQVNLLPCPVGFQLVRGRCVCHETLLNNNIEKCSISNGTAFIHRPSPYWMGLSNSSILLHAHCPFDYCQPEDVNISLESPHAQCQYKRSGVLCGGCDEGLSMVLGSSECKTCSNVYLMSINIFILAGMALVALLTLLNMTVSVGTLNGLILFANILQANRTTFLPLSTSEASVPISILSAFIAWLNLDLGIPMCFFDGLTTYAKTWLQFVFPLYILAMVGAIIAGSNCSTQLTRLFGSNAVPVLSTLVLLSYTKILRILIAAFSFTTLTGSEGYYRVLWLPDGNINYLEPKHAILFTVALMVLLLLGIPYTVALTASPWIQRSEFHCISSMYNKFKPLFDAYMGPYKDSCRYWTGMLLLARVVLIVLFSSIANTNTVAGPQLNLLLLTLSSSALLALTTALRPYKNKLLNGLEIFHLTILLVFSASYLYISTNAANSDGVRAYVYIILVGTCFLVFLGIFIGHICYKAKESKSGKWVEHAGRQQENCNRWQRGRGRQEEEEEEERGQVTVSTAGTTTDRWRRDSVFRESVLELS